MEDIPNNENIKKIKFRAGEYVDSNTKYSLKNTKALVLETMLNTDKEYEDRECWYDLVSEARKKKSCYSPLTRIEVTTWASLIRNAVDKLKPVIAKVQYIIDTDTFISVFNDCLNKILISTNFRLNTNCPKRLFKEAEETDLIHSSVYMNNKNHFIPIVTDEDGIKWGFCAVYTGEIIVMLEALLDSIHYMIEEYRPESLDKTDFYTIIITYKIKEKNEDTEEVEAITEQVNDIDKEIQDLEMSKDLMNLQRRIVHIHSVTGKLYEDIENIQKKYGLKTLEDFWNSVR